MSRHNGKGKEAGSEIRFRIAATPKEIQWVVRKVRRHLKQKGWEEDALWRVELGLHEALLNSYQHGCRRDPRCRITVRCCHETDRMQLIVEDEGEGFNPAAVADPTRDEYMGRPAGRGMFLIRRMMHGVRYSERGNQITMVLKKTEN